MPSSPLLGVVLGLLAFTRVDGVSGTSAAGCILWGSRSSILPLRGGGDVAVDASAATFSEIERDLRLYEPTNGATPLLNASREGHLEAVQTLLKEGADVDEAFPESGFSLNPQP